MVNNFAAREWSNPFHSRGAIALWNGGSISFEGSAEFTANTAINDNGGEHQHKRSNFGRSRFKDVFCAFLVRSTPANLCTS